MGLPSSLSTFVSPLMASALKSAARMEGCMRTTDGYVRESYM
jgi:hypothetical protein